MNRAQEAKHPRSCPFCGSYTRLVKTTTTEFDGTTSSKAHVLCEGCGAQSGKYQSARWAIKAWNNRKELSNFDFSLFGIMPTTVKCSECVHRQTLLCPMFLSGEYDDYDNTLDYGFCDRGARKEVER